jgi:PAS domain S-box-containing protein
VHDELKLITDAEGNPSEIVGYWTDITEEKRAEERLVKINQCLSSLGIDTDVNIGRIVALCGKLMEGACALYNRLEKGMLCSRGQWNTPLDYNPIDEPEGHICYDVIKHGGTEPLVVRNLSKTKYAETDPNVNQYKLQTYIGKAISCAGEFVGSLCVVYQKDFIPSEADNELMGIIASALESEEERRRASDALQESEERFRRIFEQSNDAVFLHDFDGNIIDVNSRACEMLGYSRDELLKLPVPSFHPKDELGASKKAFQVAIEEGSVRFESRFKTSDDTIINVDISSSLVDREKNLIQGVVRDITERKQAEVKLRSAYEKLRSTQAQLIQTEKMSGIGKLGAGVAHELNSPLAGLISLIETYLERAKEGTRDHRDFAVMLDASRHMARIVKDLGAFSRESKGEKTEVGVNEMIDSTLSFSSQQLARRHIKLIKDFADDLPRVKGERGQLQQVVLNIISNAHGVMLNGGEFIIRTRRSESGDNVIMEFIDNGPGIKQEDLPRIFDPFFTTKGPGKGVGLGLSVSYAIVEEHGGKISVESQLGKGTRFTVVLPSAKKERG